MAQPQANKKEETKAPSNPAATPAAPPSGYKRAATDAIGFFDGDLKLPIHFIPLHVNLSDSTIDKKKPSALIFGRLLEPCSAIRSAEGDGPLDKRPLVPTKKDDVVGVWFSAGMRDLAMAAGVPAYMVYEGEKPIKGKPSPMKAFGVYTPKPGSKLEIREDRRVESRDVDPKPFSVTTAPVAKAADTDEVPF